ncbi:MAG: TraB/GumN family protein [Bacteroidetes bacterium]|jgi:uncharacterized protein YbaP (TraB family)|nr:TraB/GumN family protein [Bacteroidota bacterium]
MKATPTARLSPLVLFVVTLSGVLFFPYRPGLAQAEPDSTNHLLWRIEAPGATRPSYLYGTMHSKQKEVFGFSKTVSEALLSCDAFAAELELNAEALVQAQHIAYLPQGEKLTDYLTPREYDSLRTVLRQAWGEKGPDVIHFRPFFLMVYLDQYGVIEGDMPLFLDQYLYELARGRGLQTHGLESVQEQMQALQLAETAQQARQLMAFVRKRLKEGGKDKAQDELYRYYLAQDLAAIGETLQQPQQGLQLDERLLESLLKRRNHLMTHRIDSLIQRGSLFAAIGAAHLPGPGGVIALLRARGYTVRPVPFIFDHKGYIPLKEGNETAAGWEAYEPQDHSFRAYFPGQATTMERTHEGVEMTLALYTELASSRIYSVSYAPQAAEGQDALDFSALNKRLNENLAARQAQLVSSKPFSAYGLQGLEAQALMDNLMRFKMDLRIFTHNKRVFTLMVVQPEADYDPGLASRFFHRFALLRGNADGQQR